MNWLLHYAVDLAYTDNGERHVEPYLPICLGLESAADNDLSGIGPWQGLKAVPDVQPRTYKSSSAENLQSRNQLRRQEILTSAEVRASLATHLRPFNKIGLGCDI